jgi:MoaA/NifB/PqqE/SkfB family radical SAM enzyme
MRSIADPRQVGYLILYVTNRCNFRCNFCFYHQEIAAGRKPDELTLDEHRQIARKVGPLTQLSMTGGEPFVRKEFVEISQAYLEHTRPRYVTIPTNAWFTDRIVEYLERVVPAFPQSNFRLVLSVEDLDEEHDAIRDAAGSFERIVATHDAVSPLRERFDNLVLDANTVLTSRTESRVVDTLRELDRRFTFDNLSVTHARGKLADPALRAESRRVYRDVRAYLDQRHDPDEGRFLSSVWRAIDEVTYDHFERTVFDDEYVTPCVAGRKLVIVSETGEVHPCEILDRPLGNLRDHGFDLARVLSGPVARETVDWIRETQCRCGFECALAANAVWSPRSYPAVARAAVRRSLPILR